MGRIKKVAGPKHEATLSPALATFITTATELSLPQIPTHLFTFPIRWPFPRGDLYHWIPLLNRFDSILEHFTQEYCLDSGPQTQSFARALLLRGIPEEGKDTSAGSGDETLDLLGFGVEGDRELVEAILNFSRMLLENCGNRSLYNSSDRLGEILNTTSLSLLSCTLRLAVRLAQRYHASRQRGANASQHLNNTLLASHYNIDLEKVQKLAVPFIKPPPPSTPGPTSVPGTTPTPKGKDRGSSNVPNRQSLASLVNANDLLAMARDELLATNGISHKSKGQKTREQTDLKWEDWGSVCLTYYQTPSPTTDEQKASAEGAWVGPTPSAPTTPTPNRRTSGVSRPSRLSSSEESPSTSAALPIAAVEEPASGGMKTIEVPYARISSTDLDQILKSTPPEVPKDSQYDLLCKLRIARALTGSLSTRREILAIRVLAITNLAYIYPEATFQQKILQQDSDEPRRLQLAYQLADLVHPPGHGGAGIPVGLQTLALGALEALAKHKSKAPDVCAALNVNVNHGVLFYILRKAVADMGVEDIEGEGTEGDEWRDALFSLLEALPAFTPRTGETLVAAGLLEIMIEILTLRTQKAERNHPKVLTFLNTIIYTVRDAFQTFANSKGLDTISDLTAYEVQSSLEKSQSGYGLPRDHRNQVIDYQVPYFQQQTLRWLFKFVNHMMQHGSSNFDRLLRNLIDSPQLLGGLRTVIVNAPAFGSNVWSGAVNILSSFIHNEPTSYAVIAEAGLSKGLLEAVTSRTINATEETRKEAQEGAQSVAPPLTINTEDAPIIMYEGDEVAHRPESPVTKLPRKLTIVRPEKRPLAQGILPATDAIVTIPQAFGAICLNTSGMELFQASCALDSFFEIFESPDHVKSMTSEVDLPRILGNSFDELVRHHPPLKKAVMESVMMMTARVGFLCKSRAWEGGVGAKLWVEDIDGQKLVAGGAKSLLQGLGPLYAEHVWSPKRNDNQDTMMGDASSSSEDNLHEALAEFERTVKAEDIIDREDDQNGPSVSTYINVAVKFLAGFFENTSLCSSFVELGGLDSVLDFATMPTLPYDFNSQDASQEVARVIHMLAEQKPHLVFPSLVRRTQTAADRLEPLMNHDSGYAFFAPLTSCHRFVLDGSSQSSLPANGTLLVKSLVSVQTLCNVLSETFSPPIYTPRSSHTVFSQVNLTDMYIKLAKSLGRLHRACVWEEILLQTSLPDTWKEATRIKGFPLGSDEANEVFGFIGREEVAAESSDPTTSTSESIVSPTDTPGQLTPTTATSIKKPTKASVEKDNMTAQFKNVRTLRYLLSQIPSSITPFFQGLGKALITKRRPESYPRQNAYMVADALAEATLEQLRFGAHGLTSSPKDMYAYWIVILTSVSQLMIEGPLERPHSQCLTLVLQAFKNHGGLASIKDLLEKFFDEVTSLSSSTGDVMDDSDGAARLASAYGGIKIILTFYTQITNSKYIVDATQTSALESNSRDREQPHYFSPAQFLVELRMAVLPVVRKIWNSDFVDKASSSIVKCLIEILKTVLDGEHEHGAFKRSEKIPARGTPPFKIFQIPRDKVSALIEKGYEKELICEALYRCHNNQNAAEEYCKALQSRPMLRRNPIPSYDKEREKSPSPHRSPQRQDSEATIPDLENTGAADQGPMVPASSSEGQRATRADSQVEVEVEEAETEDADSRSMPPPPPAPGAPSEPSGGNGDGLMRMSIDNLLNQADMLSTDEAAAIAAATTPTNTTPSPTGVNQVEVEKSPKVITLDDLNEERLAVRNNLIDRALDVLNVHGDVTFELADLITAAAAKATDVTTMRREIGETLVQSLISFQMDEDFRSAGKKIAAYANLLALVLQEREFYDATLDELKGNFADLLGFVKVFPDQTPEESSPWIGQILLIVEKLLAEDAQPQRIEWTPPSSDEPLVDTSIAEMEAPLIPMDEKMQLFEAINEILPRIGKDESLALSVVRVLVILTRNRVIASKLGDRRNMQRLFVMVKQLAGITNEKLQSSFMLVLRHVIEDDETIRQIMRSEIVANFETRPTRPTDTTGYVRQFYHLLLRSPEIFIEVTNEKLKLQKFDASQPPQTLVLKSQDKDAGSSAVPPAPGAIDTTRDDGVKEAQVTGDVKPTTEESDQAPSDKPKPAEIKPPVVENPDGVIHYLLCELLSYKDVEDKDPSPPAKEPVKESTPSASSDVEMVNGTTRTPGGSPAPVETAESKKADKPEFKADQHPIYIYRCFLLQCLTELLSFYNRSKVEFINFSRKADPKAMTPSKPRSGVLNYLLNAVIPVGTLNHEETISFRKKSSTSNWAMSAIVALCLKTGERGYVKKREQVEEDDEPDLLFVRKFVLEHALKAYKDASASNEPLDVKYSRMLCIADLFHRLLSGRLVQSATSPGTDTSSASQKQLARLMFEKNFLSALTSSIADIDLNFPGSKRAVKYILRPLKQLTHTAIILSESSSISTTPGQTDDDEISTATSVSDMDDEREETPDLFRNSTLGMFEPNREEESSSESSEGDEDMYDDEYGEDMEYEEEVERDGDEVISDEEEELEGVGHVEGLPGDVGMDLEVVLDGDENDDDEEDHSEDVDDDLDDMDDGEEVEIVDEINGDNENDSLADGEDEEWQDEDEEAEGYEGEMGLEDGLGESQDPESVARDVRDIMREFQAAAGVEAHLEGGNMAMDMGEEYMDDIVHGEDDDEDEDDEDDMEEEDVIYQPEFDDDDTDIPQPPWGWDPDEDPGMPMPRGHRHRLHGMPSPWTIFPGGPPDRGMLVPTYRSHRPSGAPRGNDDGTNPLLQRNDRAGGVLGFPRTGRPGTDTAASMSDWVHAMDPGHLGRPHFSAESPVSFVNNIISAIGQGAPGFATMGGPNGGLHFHIAGAGPRGLLPRELQAMLGLRRAPQEGSRPRDDPTQSATFLPTSTVTRWQEEARLLFGNNYVEKTQRVINSLLRVLVPPAMEAEKIRKEKDIEAAKKLREERERKLEEERLAQEKAEKEAHVKREQEQHEAAAAAETATPHPPEGVNAESQEGIRDEGAMEGVQHTTESAITNEAPTNLPTEGGPSEPSERVRTTIRGRELDITGMGIDLEYLEALPEELREEVLMHQLAEQRSQAAAAGEEPTDISREFLEALPPEIREELLQQEAQDRRRRERDENRRRAAASGGPPAARAEEMDPASFFASLEPGLRQSVLMETDEEVLAHLPQAMVAEARALGSDRNMHRFGDHPRLNRTRGIEHDDRTSEQASKKPQRRQIVQMLDKAGVATLLRLMFVPQQGSSRQSLNGILLDVSQNRQNRAEVVSLLLSILQDGSADVNAVERSFAHLSLRAKQPATQKTPQPLKRTLTGPIPQSTNTEMTPLMVIQQCLSALVSLTQYNPHIPSFFLTEHETTSGLKNKSSRKGKGKETRAAKFALNALLSLLDRKLIMESSSCMEQLSSLLQSVTHPLTMLLRKDKERIEDPIKSTDAPNDQITEGAADNTGESTQNTAENIQSEDTTMAEINPVVPDALGEAPTTAPTASAIDGPTDSEVKPDESKKAADEESSKKQRTLIPPVVPESNLRLVVNILAARECSAKTFRDTLSTINNLSAIPQAKEIFGKELIKQAQELGESILSDLDELVPQIQRAESGTDIQGMALAKFSPASSDQAKLLRVLTALDYLFDPKRNGGKTKPTSEEPSADGKSSLAKEDLLTTLYENPTFGLLWTKLSDCLSAIRQRENMLNVATILLPLIEALMVVCKNTTLKDASVVKAAKHFAVTSPPPESQMETLFFRFTEDHRKILNDLVRHNPKLMSGTFSLLVKNPKVLEFDNKRNYFTRRLHSRGTEARHPQQPLQLSVRRDQVFLDSFKSLYFKSPDEMKYGKLSIRFHGEEGVDAGGVTREWFQVLSRQMFNPDYALFVPVAADRTTFHPNKLSTINPEHLYFFKFIGRVIGKALYEGRALDCHFSRAVYKRILGKPVSIKDMETLDLDYYKSLLWMLENDITDIITENFCDETEAFGDTQIVDLIENGRNIPVTEENKQEYVQLLVEYRLTGSVQAQLEEFLKGFHDIVPAELISIFNEQELELLISGLPDIDVDDWKNNTEYHNYSASSPQIQWFWRAVRSFDKEERAKLLQFVTGTSKVPLNGFKELEGMNGFSRFNIHRDYGNKDRLPSSHTCFNQLDLPEYESYEALRQQVYTAMTAGSEYFGFA